MSWTDADVVEEIKPKQQAWSDDDVVEEINLKKQALPDTKIATPKDNKQKADRYSSAILKGFAGLAGLPADILTTLGSPFGDLGKPEVADLFTKESIVKGIEKVTGTPLYKPETTGQRYFEKAVEGGISLTPAGVAKFGIGALSGLGGAAGEDFGSKFGKPGAVIGGIAGSLAPFFVPAAVIKPMGAIYDIASGRASDIRAGKILRNVAGDKRAEIEAAMYGKGNDLNAAQAAVEAGSTRWSALGKRAAKNRSEYFKELEDAQELKRLETLSGIAGGGTQTEAKQAQDIFKKAINSIRGPEREMALSNANKGLVPLKPDSIISKIDEMLKDPRIGPDDLSSRALRNVRSKLMKWTSDDGVIDADALETIRKRAVNDVIERYMGSADPKTKAKRASEIMGQIKEPIINAIEDAGGIGYGAYLRNYADDMTRLNRQKLTDELYAIYSKSPDKFVSIVKGGDPAFVKEIMGTEYDIAKALGKRYAAVEKVAEEIGRDKLLSDLSAAGTKEVSNILARDASRFKLPQLLNRYATVTNKAIDIAEETLNAKTMEKVYEAMKNPNDALRLLNELPTIERVKAMKLLVYLQNNPKSVRAIQETTQE